jgi:hypothetical protein
VNPLDFPLALGIFAPRFMVGQGPHNFPLALGIFGPSSRAPFSKEDTGALPGKLGLSDNPSSGFLFRCHKLAVLP